MKQNEKRDAFLKKACEFSLKNKESICIMADMETNMVVMAYGKFICAARNKGKVKTIKNLVELNPDIKIRDTAINQFSQELDGMFYAISEQMYNERTSGVDKSNIAFKQVKKNEKGNTEEVVELK